VHDFRVVSVDRDDESRLASAVAAVGIGAGLEEGHRYFRQSLRQGKVQGVPLDSVSFHEGWGVRTQGALRVGALSDQLKRPRLVSIVKGFVQT